MNGATDRTAFTCGLLLALLMPTPGLGAGSTTPPRVQQDVPNNQENIERQIVALWERFRACLLGADSRCAVALMAPDVRDTHEQSFRDLGDELRQMPAAWSELKFVSVDKDWVLCVITDDFGGRSTLHEVHFYRDKGGRWLIAQL